MPCADRSGRQKTRGSEVGRNQRWARRQQLNVRLESGEISLEVVHRIVHVLLGHRCVGHQVLWNERSCWVIREYGGRVVGASERENREVSPDVVRARIRQDYVFEPSGRDLVIVSRVPPGTNTRR